MLRRKDKQSVRKLQRTGEDGESYIVTLPRELITELGWQKKQKVVVKRKGKKLIIEDWEQVNKQPILDIRGLGHLSYRFPHIDKGHIDIL